MGAGFSSILKMKILSGQRDSNARHQPWQGCALPLSYARTKIKRINFIFLLFAVTYENYHIVLV